MTDYTPETIDPQARQEADIAVAEVEEIVSSANNDQPPPIELTHPGDIDAVAGFIYQFLVYQGRATRAEIRQVCSNVGVDTATYRKAHERLDRQLNVITEVTNDNGAKAWAVKDWALNNNVPFKTILEVSQGAKPAARAREVFGDWYTVEGYFEVTSNCLSSAPVADDPSARRFLRTANGNVLFISGYYEAMLKAGTQMPGAPAIGNARFRIRWFQQEISKDLIELTLRPVPPSRPGASGQGVTSVESLLPGTHIPFKCIVPGTHVDPVKFETMLDICGDLVGLSPSAAHKGFGRFNPTITRTTVDTGFESQEDDATETGDDTPIT